MQNNNNHNINNNSDVNLKNKGLAIPKFNDDGSRVKSTQFIESNAKRETYSEKNLRMAESTSIVEKNLDNIVKNIKDKQENKIIATETDKNQNIKNNKNTKINSVKEVDFTLRIFLFSLLTILTIGGIYFFFNYSEKYIASNVETEEKSLVFENNLIRANKNKVVGIESNLTSDTIKKIILDTIKNEKLEPEQILIVVPSYLKEVNENKKIKFIPTQQRGDDFLFTFAKTTPLTLRTTLGVDYAYGAINNQRENKRFLILSIGSIANATRDMLTWENSIYNDLKELLNLREVQVFSRFKDVTANNHILRVLEDAQGVIMVYGFSNKALILTTDINTYNKVHLNLK